MLESTFDSIVFKDARNNGFANEERLRKLLENFPDLERFSISREFIHELLRVLYRSNIQLTNLASKIDNQARIINIMNDQSK